MSAKTNSLSSHCTTLCNNWK